MSEYVCYVMREKAKPSMGKWKYLFALDALILLFILGLLIYLRAIWI